jgi:hypothetical protein
VANHGQDVAEIIRTNGWFHGNRVIEGVLLNKMVVVTASKVVINAILTYMKVPTWSAKIVEKEGT